jgi:hypothetical protein
MRSDQLAAAQRAVRVINVLSVFLGLVVIALVVLALYLARGFRREALRGAGAIFLVVGVILLIVRRLAGNAVVESLTAPQTEPGGARIWLHATDLLVNVGLAFIIYSSLALLRAWHYSVPGSPVRAALPFGSAGSLRRGFATIRSPSLRPSASRRSWFCTSGPPATSGDCGSS